MANCWKEEIESIGMRMHKGDTLDEIAKDYGVSRQRIYQVLTKYGLNTPLRCVKNSLRGKGVKHYWLHKMMSHKGISKAERMFLIESLELPDYCPILGMKLEYDRSYIGKRKREDDQNKDGYKSTQSGTGFLLKDKYAKEREEDANCGF